MSIGNTAAGMMPNRRKYQGNEFITEAGLDWMSFGARQYDPQMGRFLSIDPLAGAGGQDRFSPFAAMGDEPASMVDPNGMATGPVANPYYMKTTGPGYTYQMDAREAASIAHIMAAGMSSNSDLADWDLMFQDFAYGGGGGSAQQTITADMVMDVFNKTSGIGTISHTGNGAIVVNYYSGNDVIGGEGADPTGIGITYKNGITIYFHSLTGGEKSRYNISSGNTGIYIQVGYNASIDDETTSKFISYQWVQTVETNYLIGNHVKSPFIDGEAPPFMKDEATMDSRYRMTIQYGFSMTNGEYNIQYPSFVNTPNDFHQQTLNCLP